MVQKYTRLVTLTSEFVVPEAQFLESNKITQFLGDGACGNGKGEGKPNEFVGLD